MSKRTMILVLVAAAAVAGIVLWSRRRRQAAAMIAPPAATVAPTQLAPQAIVANAFSDLLNAGANWAAQYIRDKGTRQPDAVPYKPPPIASKPATAATPISNTPAVVTTPTGYYA
jgi:uncharacterized iron-regulated membrane protein